MANFRDTLIQTVKDRFPNAGWKYGSLIRELIIEPLCAIGDIIDQYINQKLKLLDVRALIDAPAENEEQIDEWLDSLNLSVPNAIPATGSIIFISSTNDDITIPEGSTFNWNETYTVYASETITFNKDNPLKRLSEGSYLGEIPVTTGSSSLNISIAAEAPMNWSDAPDTVYDIYVGDAISGGRQDYSIQQKAQILSSVFSETGLCGKQSIYSTLSRMFPDSFIDVAINKSCKNLYNNVSLFFKQKREVSSRSIKCNVLSDSIGSYITVPTDAVIEISGIYSTQGHIIEYTIDSINSIATFGDYNSSTKVRLLNCLETSVIVQVKEFSDIKNFMRTLNTEVAGTPFSFSCELPAIATVSLQIPVNAEISNTAVIEIQEYITESKLDSVIYDSEIAAILRKYDIELTGGILYSGEIKTADHCYGFTMTGHLALAGYQGLTIKPVAVYTSANLIKGVL